MLFRSQEKSYYCGPATVQQILRNNGNQTVTQDDIAAGIGTTKYGSDLAPMPDYIRTNSVRGFVGYDIYKNLDFTSMKELIARTVYFMSGAPIARIVFSKGGSWPYSSGGHFLNVTGYDYSSTNSSNYTVKLTDPNIKNVDPSSDGTYWVYLTELHQATMDANHKEMAGYLY